MIVSTDPRDMLRPDVVEVRARGNEFHGLQVSDWTGETPTTHPQRQARIGTVLRMQGRELNSGDVTVPAYFSGNTIENVGLGDGQSPHPVDLGLRTHWHRCLAFGSYWPEIETSAGGYNFTRLKAALQAAKARGCKTLWNIAYTPTFYGSDINAHRSSGQAVSGGWASAPSDLQATMQADPRDNSAVLRNFCTAAMTEIGDLLDVVVFWNEPNFRRYSGSGAPYGNWFDTSDEGVLRDLVTVRTDVSGNNQRYAQFVRLQACAYHTIKALRPSIVFCGPDFFGEASSQSSVGGKQAGRTCFGQWLADGGAAYCDAYSWHSYTDLYQLTGIAGVDWRLSDMLRGLDDERASRGAPAKPWYCTEVGHEELGTLALQDQRMWALRNHLEHASQGWQSIIAYAWDSLSPATYQMSWYLRNSAGSHGLTAGVQPIALFWDESAGLTAGRTISAGAVRLVDGRWCGRIDGVPYVV